MTNQMKIPDELELAFQHLINLLPNPLKGNDHTQQIILTYLKLGGEKLASKYIFVKKPLKNRLKPKRYRIFTLPGVIYPNLIYLKAIGWNFQPNNSID